MGSADLDAFRAGKPALVSALSFRSSPFLFPVPSSSQRIQFKMRCTQANVIDALLKSVSETAQFLRQEDTSGQVGSSNTFGDQQLKVRPHKALWTKFLKLTWQGNLQRCC